MTRWQTHVFAAAPVVSCSTTDHDPILIGSSRIADPQQTPEGIRRRRRRRLVFLFVLIFLVIPLLTVIWSFTIEPALLTVTRYTYQHAELPQQWHGRTIAFFTDTHLGPAYSPAHLARVAEAIEREKPDLILFGGDLIDNRTPHDPEYAAKVAQLLARMQAPFGQYAVAGNHDNRLIAEYRYMAEILKAGGFTLLDNQSVVVDGLWIGGLAESYFGRPDWQKTFSTAGLLNPEQDTAACSGNLFRLLLMHQPDYTAALPAAAYQLAFSGHSHNGQITFFGRPIITVFEGRRYTHGHYQLGDGRSLIVSRGLGTIGIPARLGAPPQLVIVSLEGG